MTDADAQARVEAEIVRLRALVHKHGPSLAGLAEKCERQEAEVAHYQRELIATCAAKAEVQRREAELRARIEALCDEWERMWGDFVTIAAIRAALSPAEETP